MNKFGRLLSAPTQGSPPESGPIRGPRFPWGSVLAPRCGSLSAPLDIASGGLHPPAPSSQFVTGCLHQQPRPFAWPEKGRVDEAIRCRQLQPITMRRTSETGTFSVPRMRTPRGLSGALWSLHRAVSTSDVPSSLAGTPESVSVPPDVLSVITLLADGEADLTSESKDFCFVRPLRARRASARERLPSYREPASD